MHEDSDIDINVPIMFGVAALLHLTGAVRILWIFWANFQRQSPPLGIRLSSTFLLTLFINWLVVCLLILPYEVYGVLSWIVDEDGYRNGFLLFALGMPPHIFGLAMLPVSVFYLTLERIYVIYMGGCYSGRQQRHLLGSYGATLILGACVVGSAFYLAFQKVEEKMPCEFNGCLLGPYVKIYLGWRAFCAVFNFSAAVLFFHLFYNLTSSTTASNNNNCQRQPQQQKQKQQQFSRCCSTTTAPPPPQYLARGQETSQICSPYSMSSFNNGGGAGRSRLSSSCSSRSNRMNNWLTLWVIVSEFLFSFLPHFGPFVWEQVFGDYSSMDTGPLSELASAMEVTVFTLVFSRLFSSHSASSTSNSGGMPTADSNNISNQNRQNAAVVANNELALQIRRQMQFHRQGQRGRVTSADDQIVDRF